MSAQVSAGCSTDGDRLQVVAAVIRRDDGRILISRRPAHVDQGDLWEFPGGKRDADEAPVQALVRELHEELGIDVLRAIPLLRVPHDYATRRVLLDVFVVDRWHGDAHGREGQAIRWVTPGTLATLPFPAANLPIAIAARLPRACVVTPEPTGDTEAFIAALEACLARGARLVQLRAPALPPHAYRTLAVAALACCRARDAQLLLNADPALAVELGADGAHLNGQRLARMSARPVSRALWLSASCHSADELAQARRIGVDFAFVSPVLATASHPTAAPLGWPALAALVAPSALPVYALGGVGPAQFAAALAAGCIGVAGIGAFWRGDVALDDAALSARYSPQI
ncbi:MAG: Nudix family hydrolase [Gammaproteobacteria bacterium]|nr:Nudix family hydrolase [Gammaproteobacteria bacterium]